MIIETRLLNENESALWDRFVASHDQSGPYLTAAWRQIIGSTYRHTSYVLVAYEKPTLITGVEVFPPSAAASAPVGPTGYRSPLLGVLHIIHMRHPLFGNRLISLPYLDSSGILARNGEASNALLQSAIQIGRRLKVQYLELRQPHPLEGMAEPAAWTGGRGLSNSLVRMSLFSDKSRMLLPLPGSSDELMKSFKSKLRNQITKSLREGLTARVGAHELVEDFYVVFSRNMRDLGSPVHDKALLTKAISEIPDCARLIVVYHESKPMACGFIIGHKRMMTNPWASALKEYSKLNPNMLLYWSMLQYASDHGYALFDFGRSTPGEGTFRFKEQWGAKPHTLYWYRFEFNPVGQASTFSERTKFDRFIAVWKKVPVPIANRLGPPIRKHIGL
jgi:FemAB-related protein (PEP-CTERM system-associated)